MDPVRRDAKSYRDLQSRLDAFSNAFVPWETMVTSQLPLNPDVAQQIPFDTLHSLGSLYFCVPGNEKLDDLWDTAGLCRDIPGT